ncbi:MAG: adenosylcobinamide-GDP ribazoletransferase [Bacillota bacterium]
MGYLKLFVFALTFLTRIPVPMEVEFKEDMPARSMVFYPLVGLVLGLVLVLVDRVLINVFSLQIVSVLLLVVLTYLSGGIHLDGFMDTMDGLFSGRNKEKILTIMHDSRVGAFGVIGFFLLYLLKFNLLVYIITDYRIPVLLLMPVVSRWLIVMTADIFPLNEASKMGQSFKSYLGKKQVLGATCWLLLVILVLHFLSLLVLSQSLSVIFVSLAVVWGLGWRINRRIEGLSGDIYGFVSEMAEVILLLIFATLS